MPAKHQPYFDLLLAAVETQRAVDAKERARLQTIAAEVVEVLVAEVSPYFFRPNREPAQLQISGRVFELLVRKQLAPNAVLEPLVTQILDYARANLSTLQH